MQVGSTGIEVVIFTAEEEHGTTEVDRDAYRSHPCHYTAGNGLRMLQAVHRLYAQYTDSYEQDNGIYKCSEYRRFLIAVGVIPGRPAAC